MKQKLKLLLLLFLFVLTFLSLFILWKESNRKLKVAFLNIGQGDSIFIESPTGNQMIIDGGPGRSVLRELGSVMPFYDKSIDVVLATHPDADHVGGLNDVLENFKTDLFMEPGVEADTNIYTELKNKVEQKKIKTIEARRGMVLDLGGGAFLEILFPITDPRGMETNDASIVARLVYGESTFLFTGDAPFKTENGLLFLNPKTDIYGSIDSDVLKVGHHGSKNSTSVEFVKAVSPEYAVISVGADNRYGHPTEQVLDILKKENIKTFRTDLDGRVIFESDGVNLKQK